MIPMLIIYIFKRSRFGKLIIEKANAYRSIVGRGLSLLLILLVTNVSASNFYRTPQTITFKIVKNNKPIGSVTIYKQEVENSIIYTLESKIDTQFIIKFDIEAREKSVYKEGALVYSSIFRKLNDKVKINQSLSFHNGQYIFENMGKEEALSFNTIHRNLVTLFFNEPVSVHKIYSDKFKKMVSVTPLSKGKYKIVFPENNNSIYHYKNGKCTMIEAKGPFYKVKLIPENK